MLLELPVLPVLLELLKLLDAVLGCWAAALLMQPSSMQLHACSPELG